MFLKLALLSARFPKSVVLATIALTAAALVSLGNLKIDANPYPLSRSHPSMVALQKLKTDFTGTLEVALIHLRHEQSIYNPGTFRRIVALTKGLEELTLSTRADEKVLAGFLPQSDAEARGLLNQILEDGITRDDQDTLVRLSELVEKAAPPRPALKAALDEVLLKLYPVKKVTSLSTVENIVTRNDALKVGKVFRQIPATPAEWEQLKASIRSNEVFQKILVSKDEKSTGIQAETYIPDKRADLMFSFNEAIAEVLNKIPGPEKTYVAGFAIVSATFNNSIQQDNARLFPFVILIVLLTLFMTFRTFGGVLLPLAVVIISIVWTMGIMVLVDVPLNMMTTVLPVFLIAIGVADGVHIVSEFKDRFQDSGNRKAAVRATMEHMTLPVVMTSLTTAVGFISLAFTDIDVIQKFGIFVAVGVMAAMVFSLTFIPAALSLLGDRKIKPAAQGKAATSGTGRLAAFDAWSLRMLVAVSDFAVRRNRWVLGVSLMLVVAAGFGLTHIRAENDFLTYFSEDRQIVQSARSLNAHMAGSNGVNILVRAPQGGKDPFKDPKNLAAVARLQDFLGRNPIVGKSLSLVDVLKRINLVLHNNDPAYNRLPKSEETAANGRLVSGRNLVAQYLLLYENGGGENLSDNTDAKFETMNVSAILNSQNSVKITELITSVEEYAAANFPPGMTLKFAGNAEMSTTTNNVIVKTQSTSLAISVVVVFFLLLLQFRSWSKGLLAFLPLALTVILNFGLMGLLGIHLDVATAVISSIVIGISVDFAIHYLSRLNRELETGVTQREAFANTMRASGKAITANAFIVALGFLALLMSDLYPLQLMGLLIFQTLLFSAFATLLLLPAAASFFKPGFLRIGIPANQVPALDGGG